MPVPIDDFRIDKERLAVAVTTERGERLRGDLFVQRFARYRVGRAEAVDVLYG